MALQMSCALATSPDSPEHVRIAEQLGFTRAYLYDSPPLYSDVWMQLGRAADRTTRIGLGPSGLIPSNRTVLTTASAIATLAGICGEDRVTVAIGTGMTSRLATGRRPLRWGYVTGYVRALRALLGGEAVEWEGELLQMLHSEGFASLPVDVEILLAVAGPKGQAAAREVADGVFGGLTPVAGFDRSPALCWGTVLDPGEHAGSERVLGAAGHVASVTAHWSLEFGDVERELRRGAEWKAAYEAVPAERRHLEMHRDHLVGINRVDRPFVDGDLVCELGLALSPAGWCEKLAGLEEQGATEVAYQPAGDIPRELERFARLWGSDPARRGSGGEQGRHCRRACSIVLLDRESVLSCVGAPHDVARPGPEDGGLMGGGGLRPRVLAVASGRVDHELHDCPACGRDALVDAEQVRLDQVRESMDRVAADVVLIDLDVAVLDSVDIGHVRELLVGPAAASVVLMVQSLRARCLVRAIEGSTITLGRAVCDAGLPALLADAARKNGPVVAEAVGPGSACPGRRGGPPPARPVAAVPVVEVLDHVHVLLTAGRSAREVARELGIGLERAKACRRELRRRQGPARRTSPVRAGPVLLRVHRGPRHELVRR